MSRREWLPDELECSRCGRTVPAPELDRLLWCERCRGRVRHRASRHGLWVGAALAAILALYIRFVVRPSTLVLGGWIATVVAAFWLGSKVAREISYGILRSRETGTSTRDA